MNIVGEGTVSPNYNNALLALGANYAMTAKSTNGFAFAGWTDGTGSTLGNGTTLKFTMAPNLTLMATFSDTNKPTVKISAPIANQRMTNGIADVKGTASDNWGLSGVWYQCNTNDWNLATTTNGYKNWTTTVALAAGTNTFKAYALDWGGNYSATSSVSFYSGNAFKLFLTFDTNKPMWTNGLKFTLQLSSNLTGHLEYSTDMIHWVKWTNFRGTNSAIAFHDPDATNSPRRFYRALVP